MTANHNIDRRAGKRRAVDTSRDHTGTCVVCDGTGQGAFGKGTCRNCAGTGQTAKRA